MRPVGYSRGSPSALAVTPLLLAALLLALVPWGTPSRALAQPEARRERVYLAELSMVLEGARRLILWAETYPNDADFAKFAYPLAERYVEMAGRMTPPGKLAVVHPHLLLVVENVERAVDAAAAGDLGAFRQRMRTVREELANLDSVIRQLKLHLPELAR